MLRRAWFLRPPYAFASASTGVDCAGRAALGPDPLAGRRGLARIVTIPALSELVHNGASSAWFRLGCARLSAECVRAGAGRWTRRGGRGVTTLRRPGLVRSPGPVLPAFSRNVLLNGRWRSDGPADAGGDCQTLDGITTGRNTRDQSTHHSDASPPLRPVVALAGAIILVATERSLSALSSRSERAGSEGGALALTAKRRGQPH